MSVAGRTSSGQSIVEQIELDVERRDTPIELSFLNDYRQLEMLTSDELFPMVLLATFSDGRILEVTQSSRVTYRSSNTRVAQFDRQGAITPAGIGSATVTATYTNGNRNVRIAIPLTVKLPPS